MESTDTTRLADTPSAAASADDPMAALRADLMSRAEAEGLLADYPDFDPDAALADPALGPILRGESEPTLRQLYEAAHLGRIVEERVRARLDTAVADALAVAVPEAVTAAVTAAVAESEERLLGHIRARGARPVENGIAASLGIQMHPAVDRLTRRERASLAERAGRGETVRL